MNSALYIMISILFGIFLGLLFSARGGLWLPSSRANIRKMLHMAEVQPGETIYELGCGDGRALIIAAREFDAHGIGYEINRARYYWAKLNVRLAGLQDRISIIHGSFFETDLSDAQIVFTFLLQKIQNKLVRKLIKELEPGARIISNTFIMPGLTVEKRDPKQQLTLYRIP